MEKRPRRCGDTRFSRSPDNGPFVRHCVRGTLIVSLRPDDLRGYDSRPLPPFSPLLASLFLSRRRFFFTHASFFSPRPIPCLPRCVKSNVTAWGRRRWSVQLIEDKIVPWNRRRWTFVVLVTCYFANDHHGRQRDPLYKPLYMSVMSESI